MTHEELVLLIKVIAAEGNVPIGNEAAEAIANKIEQNNNNTVNLSP